MIVCIREPLGLSSFLFSYGLKEPHIYTQLGFSYLDHKELFDDFIINLNYEKYACTALQKMNQQINTSKTQLRSIIGRWPASPFNSHSIENAINDIMNKVSSKQLGTFYYYTAKRTVYTPPFINLPFHMNIIFSLMYFATDIISWSKNNSGELLIRHFDRSLRM